MEKIKRKYNVKREKGFSIIEVVLSLTVISIGLVGILQLMSNNIQVSLDARDQAIAAQLAQEGAELALYVVKGKGITFSDNNYCLDYTYSGGQIDNEKCNGGISKTPTLSKDSTKGFYFSGNGGTATKFHRIVHVTDNATDNKYVVNSFVSWNGADPDTGTLTACTAAAKCAVAQLEIIKP